MIPNRDWSLLERMKNEFWRERAPTPTEAIRVADQLRRYVSRIRPDWPGKEDRLADLNTHIRVSRALRNASRLLAR